MCQYKIFMMASSSTAVRPFIELAKQLEKKVNIKVYMLFDSRAEYQSIIQENHLACDEITFIDIKSGKNKTSNKNINGDIQSAVKISGKNLRYKETRAYGIWRKIYEKSQIVKFLMDIRDIVKIIKKHKKIRVEVDKYFKQYNPDMAIVYSDIRRGFEDAGIYLAAKYGIPRVEGPIARCGTAERNILNGALCHRKGKSEKLSVIERYIIKKHAGHYLIFEDDIIFRFDPREIVAHGLLGILPQNPWVLGSGNISLAAFGFQENYEYAVSVMGEDYKRKACVTHTIEESDIIMRLGEREKIREALNQKYRFNCEKIVCFALSKYSKSSGSEDYETEKKIYIRIAHELVTIFGVVLISLHPRMRRIDYTYFDQIPGCIIVDEALYKIIPACDVLIGHDRSSIWDMVKNINITPIQPPLEMFRRGLSDEDIEDIKVKAFNAKEKSTASVVYAEDGKRDFYDLLIEKYIPQKYVI